MDAPNALFYIAIYVVTAMAFVFSVWLGQLVGRVKRKRLKKTFSYLLMMSLWTLLFIGWNFSVWTKILDIKDYFLAYQVPTAIFITLIFMIFANLALTVTKIRKEDFR